MKGNKIVFAAHDFSSASKNALEIAAMVARRTQSKLFIYHVISTSVLVNSESLLVSAPDEELKRMGALMRRGITYLKKKNPGLQIAFEMDYGFLIPSITHKIETINPWICVLGVKKRSGLDKVIFGDVCTTMIGKVNTPLFVVPLNHKSLRLENIIYGWDGKSTEVHQLSSLKELLNGIHVNITALNVSHYDEQVERNTSGFKQALKKMFSLQHTEIKQVQGLDKEVEFEKAVRKMKPDILVIYAHHYNAWQGMFHKRFSRYALKFSQSPVLIVN